MRITFFYFFRKFLRRQGTWIIRCLNRNDLLCIGAEFPNNIRIILITENSHDKEQFASFKILPHRILQHICRSRIMCSVHNKQRLSVNDCILQTFFSLFNCCRISDSSQHLKCLQCKCCILRLIRSCQCQLIVFSPVLQRLSRKIFFHCFCFMQVCLCQICTVFTAHSLYYSHSLRLLADRYNTAARFDDSCLFFCNFRKRVSKKCISDDVCCIQISSHSNFQNYQITFFFGKK